MFAFNSFITKKYTMKWSTLFHLFLKSSSMTIDSKEKILNSTQNIHFFYLLMVLFIAHRFSQLMEL